MLSASQRCKLVTNAHLVRTENRAIPEDTCTREDLCMCRAHNREEPGSLGKFCPSIRCGTRVKRGFNKFWITFSQHHRQEKPFLASCFGLKGSVWLLRPRREGLEIFISLFLDGIDVIIVKGVPRWWDDSRRFINFQVVNVPCTLLRFRNSRALDGSLVYKLLFKQGKKINYAS